MFLYSWLQNRLPLAATYDFTRLVFPIDSKEFNESFNLVRNYYIRRLWGFQDFRNICKLAGIHIFLVIDELEDWSMVIQSGLDEQLLSVAQYNDISLMLVLRTMFPKGIKKSKGFDIYSELFDKLGKFIIPQFELNQLVQLTEGLLQTCRISENTSIFPLTRDFVFSLANQTKKGGRFNPRVYIKCLNKILEKSLEIPRNDVRLHDDVLSEVWARDLIADILVEEVDMQKDMYGDRMILVVSAAAEIADKVLLHGVKDREAYNKLKISKAKKWKCRVPTDFEVLSTIKDKFYRRRLQHIIESLK
jgi:hypothetical protein